MTGRGPLARFARTGKPTRKVAWIDLKEGEQGVLG
jgi:hypothetical protein